MGNIRAALRADAVNVLYLHAPGEVLHCSTYVQASLILCELVLDKNTPIEDTLAAVQQLYESKQFAYLGLSNYAAWEVVWIWSYMRERGWVVPTVYQGMYNPLTRSVEVELLPALAKLGIAFYAYNPLCGGLLTGKHKYSEASLSEGHCSSSLTETMYFLICVSFAQALGSIVPIRCTSAGTGSRTTSTRSSW